MASDSDNDAGTSIASDPGTHGPPCRIAAVATAQQRKPPLPRGPLLPGNAHWLGGYRSSERKWGTGEYRVWKAHPPHTESLPLPSAGRILPLGIASLEDCPLFIE